MTSRLILNPFIHPSRESERKRSEKIQFRRIGFIIKKNIAHPRLLAANGVIDHVRQMAAKEWESKRLRIAHSAYVHMHRCAIQPIFAAAASGRLDRDDFRKKCNKLISFQSISASPSSLLSKMVWNSTTNIEATTHDYASSLPSSSLSG
jgi:hypothetical protein